MLFQAHDIIIDRDVGALGHGKYVVYGLNVTEKNLFINVNDNCKTS